MSYFYRINLDLYEIYHVSQIYVKSFNFTTSIRITQLFKKIYLIFLTVVIQVRRQGESRSKVDNAVEHILIHVLFQVSPAEMTIPIVCNMASVHNFTKQISQVVPWHLKNEAYFLLYTQTFLIHLQKWCTVFWKSTWHIKIFQILYFLKTPISA